MFPSLIPQREKYILEKVRAGEYDACWVPLYANNGTTLITFFVTLDALRIDGVRVIVSARLQQQIADSIGASLLTPKLVDMMWMAREVTLPPFTGSTTAMDSTAAMVAHSAKIDAALAKLGDPCGLIATLGKNWVLDNGLLPPRTIHGFPVAMNYGWHFVGATHQGIGGEPTASRLQDPAGRYLRLIQGRGTRHNLNHSDYSQICLLVSQRVLVDDRETVLASVLRDPVLASLANHSGVLNVLRQPGVPELDAVSDPP